MSLRTLGLHVEIAVSNMDLYPYDLPGRPSWGANLEQLVPYLVQTGCRNFEIWPTETIVQDVAARRERNDTELVERVVGSLHQSAFDGHDRIGRIAIARGVLRRGNSVSYGMMPIQAALSRPVPSVHYPGMKTLPYGRIEGDAAYPGSFPIVQPTPEARDSLGVQTEEGFMQAVFDNGKIGLCPDSAWARAKAKDGTPPVGWRKVWVGQFASGYVFQGHVGLDRADLARHGDPDLAAISQQEFKAFISRDWRRAQNTETGEMVTAAIENYVPPEELVRSVGQPILRFVAEVAPSLHPWDVLQRRAQHARVVENLAHIASEAGAKVLLWGDSLAAHG